jgi:RNA polymerase sigma-70 factor, ECF subfamily
MKSASFILKPETMNVNTNYQHHLDQVSEELVWIQKAKEKPEYFSPLYKKYHAKIFNYVYKRMDCIDLASDITSQIFVKAMQHIDKYKDIGLPFASWLYRIAKSEVYQYFREHKNERCINIETVQIVEIVEEFDEKYSNLEKEKLIKAISKLKEKDVQLIEMRYFEKRSHKEIGEILDITENNAKIKCFRALEKLKSHYHNK